MRGPGPFAGDLKTRRKAVYWPAVEGVSCSNLCGSDNPRGAFCFCVRAGNYCDWGRGIRVKHGEWTERICDNGEGDERFRRLQRLRSAQDFQRVRRRGRRISGAHLTLQYARHSRGSASVPIRESGEADTPPVRIGFSVSKRVGGAVTRNLVKRRLREAVRHRMTALAGGWDLVLTALPSASVVDYAQLCAELDDLLTRAGVWLTTHDSRGLK